MAKVEKKNIIEREYVIPLREKCRVVPRYKKTPKAIKSVKEFIAKHMKVVGRDLKKVKLDKFLNEYLWARGIKRPMHKVKVKAIKEGDIVRVELVDYPDKLKFKKAREEKFDKMSKEKVSKKKVEKKPEEVKESAEEVKETEKKLAEEKEDKSALVEEGRRIEKSKAKEIKHSTNIQKTKKTMPQRKVMGD